MTIKHLTREQLVQVVRNGGGLIVSAQSLTVADLVQLAMNAGQSGARLLFENSNALWTQDLVQIAMNGKGFVQFC